MNPVGALERTPETMTSVSLLSCLSTLPEDRALKLVPGENRTEGNLLIMPHQDGKACSAAGLSLSFAISLTWEMDSQADGIPLAAF